MAITEADQAHQSNPDKTKPRTYGFDELTLQEKALMAAFGAVMVGATGVELTNQLIKEINAHHKLIAGVSLTAAGIYYLIQYYQEQHSQDALPPSPYQP